MRPITNNVISAISKAEIQLLLFSTVTGTGSTLVALGCVIGTVFFIVFGAGVTFGLTGGLLVCGTTIFFLLVGLTFTVFGFGAFHRYNGAGMRRGNSNVASLKRHFIPKAKAILARISGIC